MKQRKDEFNNPQLDELFIKMSKLLSQSRERLKKEPKDKDLVKRLNADMNELRDIFSKYVRKRPFIVSDNSVFKVWIKC